MDFDYKKYSLEQLDTWIFDLLNSDEIGTQDIYDAIVKSVEQSIEHHKKYLDRSTALLSLLKGHKNVDLECVPEKTKWTLPVQQSVIDGVDDYYVEFPEDLLEKAGWEEGDVLEWIDRYDGSFELRKITDTISMEDC